MTAHYADASVEIHRYVVGPLDNNVFVLRCRETGDSLLVDAANEHERLLEVCSTLGVRSVVETHGHSDHIQAVPALRDAGYEVAVRAEDAAMLPSYDLLLDDDAVIEVGRLRIRTIHTPGHTPGSMSFHIEGTPVLLTGDTLFPGGPGNTASRIGDFPTIIKSIERRIFSRFGAETIIMPGHGTDSTIGAELPHLDEWIARGW
ncbi:MAG TPA: MBL fold metallo-hydrolase [Acidimicrobiales bacterium]|jgi:glyoxylase-like metal-dependent hydrolase (beta-lactamase superfamily II)|nr:MBL fold metallo-hydrolase [Acidimicrobiales bacterium]